MDELNQWFRVLHSGDNDAVAAANRALLDRIEHDPALPSLLLSAAQSQPELARHFLTFYAVFFSAHRDAIDLPGDLENVPFLEVIDRLIRSGCKVGALVAKPLISVWTAANYEHPVFEEALLHYREDPLWLAVTVNLLREPLEQLKRFAQVIPEVLELALQQDDEELQFFSIGLFVRNWPEEDSDGSWNRALQSLEDQFREWTVPCTWYILLFASPVIASKIAPIALQLFGDDTVGLECLAAVGCFLASCPHWMSDLELHWKPFVMRAFEIQCQLPEPDLDLLNVLNRGRSLNVTASWDFAVEIITQLIQDDRFRLIALWTINYMQTLYPEFPILANEQFIEVFFDTLEYSSDLALLDIAASCLRDAFSSMDSVDGRRFVGRLCDIINSCNARFVVELIPVLVDVAIHDIRTVAFLELCNRWQDFVDKDVIQWGIYAIALSLVHPLCWISDSDMDNLVAIIRQYSTVWPVPVAILIVVLFQRDFSMFMDQIHDAVLVLSENISELPDEFWYQVIPACVKFLGGYQTKMIFEPLAQRGFDMVQSGETGGEKKYLELYSFLGVSNVEGFFDWILDRYETDHVSMQFILSGIKGLVTSAPPRKLISIVDDMARRLDKCLAWSHLLHDSAEIFSLAFRRMGGPSVCEWRKQLAEFIFQSVTSHFGGMGTEVLACLAGIVDFALFLLQFSECGITEWFLPWIHELYETSNGNEICAKELLRFLTFLFRRDLTHFASLRDWLSELYHKADWDSELRALIYHVLLVLIRQMPEVVLALMGPSIYEQMTPARALCIFGLFSVRALSMTEDELISLLHYLEAIDVRHVQAAFVILHDCQTAAPFLQFSLHATHLQCKFVLMARRPPIDGRTVRFYLSHDVVQQFFQTMNGRRTDQAWFESFSRLWEGNQRKWDIFLQYLAEG
jgi:hypothetical protein